MRSSTTRQHQPARCVAHIGLVMPSVSAGVRAQGWKSRTPDVTHGLLRPLGAGAPASGFPRWS
jgi:hypothetical protein